jgi:hypothetical protein
MTLRLELGSIAFMITLLRFNQNTFSVIDIYGSWLGKQRQLKLFTFLGVVQWTQPNGRKSWHVNVLRSPR